MNHNSQSYLVKISANMYVFNGYSDNFIFTKHNNNNNNNAGKICINDLSSIFGTLICERKEERSEP